ncbi:MAG TPA: beta-propeller fold lactonase family protein, partial [Acidimicrobiia bacterium]|nr:beta-propeller fold lactonase family protein [Acidimicrobiia bacterium]
MRASIARRCGVLACVSMLGMAAAADAGNRLQVLQTASSSCNFYGGGSNIAVSPDGAHVYEVDVAIHVSSRNAVTGELTLVETTYSPDVYSGSYDVHVSPDGKHVYVVGYAGMAIYDRDAGTGFLALQGITPIPGTEHWGSFEISPDGRHLYVRGDDAIAVLARDATTGALTGVDHFTVAAASRIALSPDGAHLYLSTGAVASEVRTYARDAGTGLLTFVGSTPFSMVRYGGDLAVSGDGANVYLAAGFVSYYGGVVSFARDAGTGLLTEIDADTSADPALAALLRERFPETRRVDAAGLGYDEAKMKAAREARGDY